MKFPWLAVGIVPALSVPVVWAQNHASADSKADARGRLVRLHPASADDSDESQSFDRDAWRKRLTQSDLDQRQRDFDELVERARRDKSVRETIESWARDAGNADLAWTSRLLLRETDSRPPHFKDGFGWNSFGGAPQWNDLQERFNELQQQFGGMDSMFGDLQAEVDRMQHNPPLTAPRTPLGSGGGSAGTGSSQSFTLQVGPDGVTCRVHENVDGKDESKEYKAESLDALLDAHPELRDRIRGEHDGFGWSGPLFSQGFRGPAGAGGALGNDGSTDDQKRLLRPFSGAPKTDVFGIEFKKPAPEKLQALDLEPERGLSVVRTVPGTIAAILGVKPGDLLIEMNGTALYGAEDVGRVLRERAPNASLVVTLIDGKGQKRTLTWKPSPDESKSSARDSSPGPHGSGEKSDEARKP